MLKYIKNLFFKKKVKEPFYHPYPINELNTLREYEDEQHEKAMKAETKTERLDEELRRKGLI